MSVVCRFSSEGFISLGVFLFFVVVVFADINVRFVVSLCPVTGL